MRRFWCVGLAAGLAILVSQGVSRADDTIRLGGSVHEEGKVQTLGFDGDVDTELMRWGRGGYYGGSRGYYGGSRGYYGGYGGYYGGSRGYYGGYGGYHAGYRGYYGGYGGYHGGYGGYHGYYGGGYYRPAYYGGYNGAYYGAYYRPYVNGSYYGSYAYPIYSYPVYSSYYHGCADDLENMPNAVVLGTVRSYAVQSRTAPAPRQVMPPTGSNGSGDGTFHYDGGPQQTLPMPSAQPDPGPTKAPARPTVPRDGRLVSLPGNTPYAFQAYGEQSAAKVQAPAPTRVVTTNASGARLAFPAYGE